MSTRKAIKEITIYKLISFFISHLLHVIYMIKGNTFLFNVITPLNYYSSY